MYYKLFPSLFLFVAQIIPNLANGTSSNMFLCLDILLSTSENFLTKGFPGGASCKEPTCQRRRHKRGRFNPSVRMMPWKRAQKPTPILLVGESYGERSLVGYSPQGHKDSERTDVTEHRRMRSNITNTPDSFSFPRHRLRASHYPRSSDSFQMRMVLRKIRIQVLSMLTATKVLLPFAILVDRARKHESYY